MDSKVIIGIGMLGLGGLMHVLGAGKKEQEQLSPQVLPQEALPQEGGGGIPVRSMPGTVPEATPEIVLPPPPLPSPLPYLGSPELPPGFRLLQYVTPNLTGRDVRAVQQALFEAGFYAGPIHGVFDYDTSEAVKAFQRAKGLQVTGIVDVDTWLALGVLVRGVGGIEVAPKYVVWRVR